MQIALFGGSFNPPHVGHLMVCTWLLATRAADQVWLVPTYEHPFQKALAPWDDRLAMCAALTGFLGEGARVSEIEADLGGKSYTVRAVAALQAKYPKNTFELVLGSDLLDELPTWHEADRLKTLVSIRVVPRAGYAADDSEAQPMFPEVSSSQIRARLQAGETVDGLVPGEVLDHIRSRGLYRKSPGEA